MRRDEREKMRGNERREPVPMVPTPPPSLWQERKKEQRDAKAAAAVRAALPAAFSFSRRQGGTHGGWAV